MTWEVADGIAVLADDDWVRNVNLILILNHSNYKHTDQRVASCSPTEIFSFNEIHLSKMPESEPDRTLHQRENCVFASRIHTANHFSATG